MLLSILIATVPPRRKYLNRLLFNLQEQIVINNLMDKIEIIIYEDDFEKSLGEKRNVLNQTAKGRYVVIIDDDDMVSENYCKLICDVIEVKNVDQISIGKRWYDNLNKKSVPVRISKEKGYYSVNFLNLFFLEETTHNTDLKSHFKLKLGSIPIMKWDGSGFFKTLFMISFLSLVKRFTIETTTYTHPVTPIKRDIVNKIKFSDRPRDQDLEWITEMYEKDLIKTEHIIKEELYYYYFNKNMSINRGKRGVMSEDEKKKKMKEVNDITNDIDKELYQIDKINIKWI